MLFLAKLDRDAASLRPGVHQAGISPDCGRVAARRP